MTWVAPAKLNLCLHITGCRADGYHTLESLVVFTSLADHLTFAPDSRLTLVVDGPFAAAVSAEDNLVLRAARVLSREHGAQMRLTKHIPVGAGLGGGSSDAATALLALNTLWGFHYPMAELEGYARQLGSDVPACLHRCCMWMQGVGDVLTPASLTTALWAVIVYPQAPLSTPAVYAQHRCMPSTARAPAMVGAVSPAWLAAARNDLESAAGVLMPALPEVLALLRATSRCMVARMSGSGSACFGLYDSKDAADAASEQVRLQRPDVWVTSATVAA